MATPVDVGPKWDTYYRACGKAIRAWAQLETVLVFYLQQFIPVEQFRVRIIWLSLPNLDARRKLLNRLADTYLEGEALQRFTALMRRVSKLAKKRNLIAHAMGGIDSETGRPFFLRDTHSQGEMKFLHAEEFSLENVLNWADDIKHLEKALMDWLPTLTASILPSPKPSQQELGADDEE